MSMEVVNAVGRRKAAVARVYVKPGKGNITINQKPLDTYFPLEIFQYVVKQPLLVTSTTENYDITITLDGGGIKGQAEATANAEKATWMPYSVTACTIRCRSC